MSTENIPSRIQSLVNIIKVNELRTGVKDGRAWSMQDAECLLLNDDGSPASVGVLSLPQNLRGENAPKTGVYTASFALRAGLRDRRIEAVLVGLTDATKRMPQTATPAKA